jgi:hypothetical protein
MKRVFSLVLALMLVLGMVPTFAAEQTGAENLLQYGFITGDQNGDPMVEKLLYRSELAALIAELNGVKDQAGAFAQPGDYTDWDQVADWAKPYVAYAQVNGWMNGFPDGSFQADGAVPAQQLAAVLMNALGYPVVWDTVVEDAAALGIVLTGDALTRGEAFEAMWTAVSEVPVFGEDVTLGVKLGKLEPTTPVTTELAVDKVYTDNLKEVYVEFNQDVTDNDEVADETNYEFDVDLTVESVVVDGNMATLVLEDAADNQTDAQLEISDDVLAEATIFDVSFYDNTPPVALGAEVTGIRTIKVTFSEPIDPTTATKSDFEINDGDIFIKDVTPTNNGKAIDITTYSALEEGTLTVKVSSVSDYFGFSILSKTFELEVVPDTEAPYIVGYEDATPQGVTLIFNEEVAKGDEFAFANIYHTNKNNDAFDVEIDSEDKTKVDVNFDDGSDDPDLLPEGTAYIYVVEDEFQDLWENGNDDLTYKLEVEIDETAPEVDELTVPDDAQNYVTVTFTEDIDADSLDEDNFMLLEDGEEIDGAIKTVKMTTGETDEITVTFDDDYEGDYTLVLSGVEDLAGNEMTETSVNFTIDDITNPNTAAFTVSLYDAGTEDQTLVINFGEEMATDGLFSIDDVEKYFVTVGATQYAIADLEDVTLDVTNSGKSLEILIPVDEDNDNPTIAAGPGLFELTRVADVAGNKMVEVVTVGQEPELVLSTTLEIVNPTDTGIGFTAALISSSEIQITFADMMAGFDLSEFTITINGADVDTDNNNSGLAVSDIDITWENYYDVTDVIITLDDALDSTAVAGGSTVAYAAPADADAETVNARGVAAKATTVPIADEAGPEFVEIPMTTTNAIYVVFSEELAGTEYAAQDFVVTLEGDELVPNIDFEAVIDGNAVVITLTDGSYEDKDDVTVITKDTIYYIVDFDEGNEAVPMDEEEDIVMYVAP